ncbi:MAG: AtpZ/AtpI family protein [Chitinophagaceae bacterium]|nr:AtpZ/AtpI family protein [Chitinophagaceae bacterium]
MYKQKRTNNTSELMRYAGMGTQIFVGLGIAVFIGYKIDKWLRISIPLLTWLLPFSVLCMMIYRLVKETSKKK